MPILTEKTCDRILLDNHRAYYKPIKNIKNGCSVSYTILEWKEPLYNINKFYKSIIRDLSSFTREQNELVNDWVCARIYPGYLCHITGKRYGVIMFRSIYASANRSERVAQRFVEHYKSKGYNISLLDRAYDESHVYMNEIFTSIQEEIGEQEKIDRFVDGLAFEDRNPKRQKIDPVPEAPPVAPALQPSATLQVSTEVPSFLEAMEHLTYALRNPEIRNHVVWI